MSPVFVALTRLRSKTKCIKCRQCQNLFLNMSSAAARSMEDRRPQKLVGPPPFVFALVAAGSSVALPDRT